jgi:hypothetical protein
MMIRRTTNSPPPTAQTPAKPAAPAPELHAAAPAPPPEVSPAIREMVEQLQAAQAKIRELEAAVAGSGSVATPLDRYVPINDLEIVRNGRYSERTVLNWAKDELVRSRRQKKRWLVSIESVTQFLRFRG